MRGSVYAYVYVSVCVCSQARTRVQACVWADCCAARHGASESRVGTWQVSDRHVTTEGRPTLNSAWAAQELLEGAGLSCGSQGQGCRAGAHSHQPWEAGHLRSLGAEPVLMQKESWAEDGLGVSLLVFIELWLSKAVFGSSFPKRPSFPDLFVWGSAGPRVCAASDRAPASQLQVPVVRHLGLWE